MSWFSKKQNCVVLSTTESEYVTAGSCVAQILWIKQQLLDFEIVFSKVPIMCANTNAINISKNLIQHSRTKYIDIKYRLIRDHVLKGDIELEFVSTSNQLADILTKPVLRKLLFQVIEELTCVI